MNTGQSFRACLLTGTIEDVEASTYQARPSDLEYFLRSCDESVEILTLLLASVTVRSTLITLAAEHGYTASITVLRTHNCPWPEDAIKTAFKSEQYDTAEWLLHQECPSLKDRSHWEQKYPRPEEVRKPE